MHVQLVQRPLFRDGNDETARRRRSVTVNLSESPLTWLHARGLLSDRQYAAGELLRGDFERAGLSPSLTMVWEARAAKDTQRRAHGSDAATQRQIDAKARFQHALDGAGRGLADILWRVVCAGDRIPSVERALGWPARAGKLVLTLALDRVADYYRVPG
jgi:Domain of unknown function (DUF6456)